MQKIGNRYILNFFADNVEDIAEISNNKRFTTKNGIDYGVPLASSTIVITMPDSVTSIGDHAFGGNFRSVIAAV